jgi:carbon monoxide dehydrogenase subunit G
MEFENRFVVGAPVEEVWDLLMDVERVAPCMPGAQVLEQTGDDAYKVAVKVKLGPMSMLYKGDVEIVERDATTREASMRAKAKESRGQGTAAAQIHMALRERDGGTAASIVTEMQMSGKAAAMGQGVIRDVAASLTDTFARNLAGMVTAGEPAPGAAAAPNGAEPQTAAAPDADATSAGPAAEPRTDAPPPPRPGPGAAAEPEASLPIGRIFASVVSGRLQDPRALAVFIGLLAAVFLRLGIAIGRRR